MLKLQVLTLLTQTSSVLRKSGRTKEKQTIFGGSAFAIDNHRGDLYFCTDHLKYGVYA